MEERQALAQRSSSPWAPPKLCDELRRISMVTDRTSVPCGWIDTD